jgi:hypothetical protein
MKKWPGGTGIVAFRGHLQEVNAMNEEAIGERRGDAFHVTAAANMASIAAEGFRTDRRGVLGTGAYFDLDSDGTGWAPARQRYPHQP